MAGPDRGESGGYFGTEEKDNKEDRYFRGEEPSDQDFDSGEKDCGIRCVRFRGTGDLGRGGKILRRPNGQ